MVKAQEEEEEGDEKRETRKSDVHHCNDAERWGMGGGFLKESEEKKLETQNGTSKRSINYKFQQIKKGGGFEIK